MGTRGTEDKVDSTESRQGTGVIICKARHMNENIQNKGKTVIVVGGEGHRWKPETGTVGKRIQTRTGGQDQVDKGQGE